METWQHSGQGVWAVSLHAEPVRFVLNATLETLSTNSNHHVGKLPLAFSARIRGVGSTPASQAMARPIFQTKKGVAHRGGRGLTAPCMSA